MYAVIWKIYWYLSLHSFLTFTFTLKVWRASTLKIGEEVYGLRLQEIYNAVVFNSKLNDPLNIGLLYIYFREIVLVNQCKLNLTAIKCFVLSTKNAYSPCNNIGPGFPQRSCCFTIQLCSFSHCLVRPFDPNKKTHFHNISLLLKVSYFINTVWFVKCALVIRFQIL